MDILSCFPNYRRNIVPSHATHEVRAFYSDSVAPPDLRGAMAFHTWHRGKNSMLMEIEAAYSRPEIGRVEFMEIGKSNWSVADRPVSF